jgi:hypothetical protein
MVLNSTSIGQLQSNQYFGGVFGLVSTNLNITINNTFITPTVNYQIMLDVCLYNQISGTVQQLYNNTCGTATSSSTNSSQISPQCNITVLYSMNFYVQLAPVI